MHRAGRSPKSRPRGFTLVELMVAVVVAMLFAVLVMRIFALAESQKRVTTGGNDAQIGGSLGLFTLERDVRQAGHGITAFTLLGCSLKYSASSDGAAVTLPALAPVTINPATGVVPAGDANTDTLLVISGSSNSPSEGDATTVVSQASGYTVATPGHFAAGNKVIAASSTRDSNCSLTLDTVASISGSTLGVSNATAGLPIGSVVFDLGAVLQVRAYAVRQGTLTVCDYSRYHCGSSSYVGNPDVWVPVTSNVVSLRAQYGRDTTGISAATSAMDGVVDVFDQVTPGSAADATSIPTQCRWARVLALRIALVARSGAYDKTGPTSSAPTWDGSANAPIDLSGGADWKRYRYKTLQATVPIRNLIWDGAQSTYEGGSGGC